MMLATEASVRALFGLSDHSIKRRRDRALSGAEKGYNPSGIQACSLDRSRTKGFAAQMLSLPDINLRSRA